MSDKVWTDYVAKFGNEPGDAKQLQAFSKKTQTPLNYKQSNEMFTRNKGKKVTATEQTTEHENAAPSNDPGDAKKANTSTASEEKTQATTASVVIARHNMSNSEQRKQLDDKIKALFDSDTVEANKELKQLITSGVIDVDADYDFVCRNLWVPACRTGKKTIVQSLLNLKPDILNYKYQFSASGFKSGLEYAREFEHYDIAEMLILEQLGAGKANQLIEECNSIFDEDGVLSAFVAELDTLPENEVIKKGLVDVVSNMIKKRLPISSLVTNIGMRLNTGAVWECIQQESEKVIRDTNDKVGWHYLNNYISNNNSFIYRKWNIDGANDTKSDDADAAAEDAQMNAMLAKMGMRQLASCSPSEVAYLLRHVAKDQFNASPYSKMGNMDASVSDADMDKLCSIVVSEQINGKKFMLLDKQAVKGLTGALGPIPSVMFSNFLCVGHPPSGMKPFIAKYTLVPLALVPVQTQGKFPFDVLKAMCMSAGEQAANKDIKEYFVSEEQNNAEDWQFLRNYGKNATSVRLRQDTSLPYGVHCKYQKMEMVRMMGVASFNPLRYYDFEIYLNELMFRNAMLDDAFQEQCKAIFVGDDVDYMRGPLKKIGRCKVKTETDYFNEDFPTSACLLDIIRCTITFKSIESMLAMIKKFETLVQEQKCGCLKEIMRIKNGFIDYDHDKPQYTDIKYNVRVHVDNKEVIGEIQFLLENMANFKIKAHKYYNIVRREEYFDGLLKIITIKNSVDKKIGVLVANGDYKGLMTVMINENVQNLSDLKTLTGFNDWMRRIYELGRLKCVKVMVSLIGTADVAQFVLTKFESSDRYNFQDVNGFFLACASGRLKCAKYLLKLLTNAQQQQDVLFSTDKQGRSMFLKAVQKGYFDVVKYLYACFMEHDQDKAKQEIIAALQNPIGIQVNIVNPAVIKFIYEKLDGDAQNAVLANMDEDKKAKLQQCL
mmetsp:Transcript_40561/g.66645  ORF Transcript_40561/g.66645 Transcript_40561/m.66645 type:complete len:944 (+) Transcript_40561:110-2941(+)